MVVSTLAILAEAYTQNKEHKQTYPILIKRQINEYLNVWNSFILWPKKNTDEMLAEFNEQQPTKRFTTEKDQKTAGKKRSNSKYTENPLKQYHNNQRPQHPQKHKISSISYLANKLNMYPVSKEAKKEPL